MEFISNGRFTIAHQYTTNVGLTRANVNRNRSNGSGNGNGNTNGWLRQLYFSQSTNIFRMPYIHSLCHMNSIFGGLYVRSSHI